MRDKQKAKSKKQKAEELQQQIAELTEALKRERADVINIRRHHEQQTSGMRNMVKIQIVREFLPAIDNLERALAHTPKDLKDHDYVKGVGGIVKQFEKTLQDLGVSKIKSVGQPFDPKLHEAVSMEDGEESPSTSSTQAQEIVSQELQIGYTLGDETLRPAMVKVKKV